jgi:hypothetical protein
MTHNTERRAVAELKKEYLQSLTEIDKIKINLLTSDRI